MKQTAVDYLIQELFIKHNENFDFNPVFEKAKEMEKEQIMTAFTQGDKFGADFFNRVNITAEKYYNETFKSE